MNTKTFYSDEGQVLEMTMKEFCEEFGLTETERKRLYKETGWQDDEGVNWCVNREPKHQMSQLSKDNQFIMNNIEQSYIKHYLSGDIKLCEELRIGLKLYNKMFFIWEDHMMTNLIKLEETGEVSFNDLWKPWDLRTNDITKLPQLEARRAKWKTEVEAM